MTSTQLRSIRALIQRIPSDAPASAKAMTILTKLEKEVIGITSLASKPDSMKSDAANTMILNAEKARLRELAASSRSELAAAISSARATVDTSRGEAGNLTQGEYAAEIRSVFRGLSAAEKAQFIVDATKARDGQSIAAIVEAPAVLTGLTTEQVAGYREHYLDSVAPSSRHERNANDDLQAVCDTAMDVFDEVAQPSA